MNIKTLFGLFVLMAIPVSANAATVTHLHDGWHLESACKANPDGAKISIPGFPVDSWLKASVPTTVLAAQVAAGVFPDPYYGQNLRQIPGTTYPIGQLFANLPMASDSPYRCGWWYRTEFAAPSKTEKDGRVWLHFGGINYRADIWVNGHQVADKTAVAGAYRTYDIDVTDYVSHSSVNVLAVETFAPTEKDLGINWVDWNPAPPDKDMGLWGAVDLETTGPVTVRSPSVTTHFEDDSLNVADLTVYAELHNATGHSVKGVVSGSAAGVKFEQPLELAANESRTVAFASEQFPQLKVHDPKVWWPWQMGDPHLERVTVSFSADGLVTDERSVDFGIREITSELTTNGSRLFRVNGKPILIRGGGWSQDMLLRTDANRLRDQFRLVRDLGLNTIRLEGKLDTEEFFRQADENGVLVLLGWCCCDHWEHWRDWTSDDLEIAKASLRSQMLRLRQHASLLVWLNGSDNPPPANVESAYLKIESDTHWPNPILSSATERATTVTSETGVKMSGPYDYVEPSYWYVGTHYGGAVGFNTETSPGAAVVSFASRKKFLPDPEAWPPSANWTYHNGGGEFTNLKVFGDAMNAIYAKPNSAADFERLSQTMEYDSERAMFEAYSKNKYSSTGVIQWMLNNAWPSMIWHLFDYNLDAGGGYFGAKKACEPLHIQYSYDDRSIVVVNSTYKPATGLVAGVVVRGLKWNELFRSQITVNAQSDSSQRAIEIPDSIFADAERIFFIDLTLKDSAGRLVSRNFYWVPGTLTTFDWDRTDYTHTPADRYEDLSALTTLPAATVSAHAEIDNTPTGRKITLHLENTATGLAFQVNAAVRTTTGDLVAPVLWSENWIELGPGESETLTALLPEDAPASPVIQIAGWNVAAISVTPTSEAPH
jgi:exo-1,4-beta-D-glucosaminidase